jgi:peroxiredoxin
LGVRAPELRFETVAGDMLDVQALQGRRVLLNFWATWCPPCRHELPDFVRLASEADRHGVVVIGISDESADVLARFASANRMRYPLVSLDPWPAPFDAVVALPTTIVIDRRGVIESVHRGVLDYDELVTLASAPDALDAPRAAPD